MSLPIYELGKKRANPLAVATNNLKLGECECTDDPVCKDTFSDTVESGDLVVSVELDGVVHTPDTQFDIYTDAGLEAFRVWLSELLEVYELHPSLSVGLADDVFTVTHYGACLLEHITLGTTGELDATRDCYKVTLCTYRTDIVDDPQDIVYDGSQETLTTDDYPYTGDPAADAVMAATLATDMETALTDLSFPYVAGTVYIVVDDANGVYEVNIPGVVSGEIIAVGTVRFATCDCVDDFVSP